MVGAEGSVEGLRKGLDQRVEGVGGEGEEGYCWVGEVQEDLVEEFGWEGLMVVRVMVSIGLLRA